MNGETRLIDTLSSTTAVVLAGGLGTRLREVVADRPKVLAEVNGRPFLEYLLDQIIESGLRRAVLCTGYMAEQIEELFGDHYRSLELSYSRETEPLGTAGALRLALPKITTETIFVMNGDSYCEFDYEDFAGKHFSSGLQASVLLKKVDDVSRYGQVNVNQKGNVKSFQEKGSRQGPGWISAGIYMISTSLLRAVPVGRAVSLEREIFPEWIGKGFFAVPQVAGAFIDIGTPSSFNEAQKLFAESSRVSGEM